MKRVRQRHDFLELAEDVPAGSDWHCSSEDTDDDPDFRSGLNAAISQIFGSSSEDEYFVDDLID